MFWSRAAQSLGLVALAMLKPIRTVSDVRMLVSTWQSKAFKVGLVATMGALHRGHLSLINRAIDECDQLIVSIFVNPKQFSNNEDLERYPRDENKDLVELEACGVSVVYAPPIHEIYNNDFVTKVEVGRLSECMCGAARPQFFSGVATVVTKLLLQCTPDSAYFGEKDFQQLLVIKQLVKDLNIPTKIIGCPVIREDSGLALSSRNTFLNCQQRKIAPVLFKTLKAAAEKVSAGDNCEDVELWAEKRLKTSGFDAVDYVDVRDEATLLQFQKLSDISGNARVFGAANLGSTRLIDNVPV